ncbi:DUF4382 domain-containing protein [Flavobacterium sp. K5-23]|uniref:DUF4382 domain-containing protein n=1 Tax=Flavobacterium sp. K5-23 TaxID=2746225 RepID=UPI00200FA2A4|nr:DUF4382 domain-containing protein [Flavobacterium sp. K5-23]UQD56644.1 DUF4382 domain-containing protein [Flavobacterium sp. K5-23]
MKKIFLIATIIAFGITLNSCNSDSNSDTYAYNVRMTDAPGPYQEVNIDLQAVEVTGGNGQTVLLNTTAGIYNLLDLSNGVSKLIATSELSDAKVSQIRLILGSNNTVKVGNVVYPLSTPSAEQSGLKLQVHQTLLADIQNEVLLDFDANTSIVQTGTGTYKLKPVVRTVVTAITGNIKGSITPIGTLAVATATAVDGTIYSSSVNEFGQFQVSGLLPGSYTFTITPLLPLLPVTKSNVVVVAGVNTNVGVIAL